MSLVKATAACSPGGMTAASVLSFCALVWPQQLCLEGFDADQLLLKDGYRQEQADEQDGVTT